MGADILFYIQKKNKDGKWENLPLYKENKEEAVIYRRGYEVWDEIKDEFGHDMTEREIEDFVYQKEGWEYDNMLPWYTATYSLIKYLAYKPVFDEYDTPEEYFDKKRFFEELEKDVTNFVKLLDEEYTHPDRIRVVALVSF